MDISQAQYEHAYKVGGVRYRRDLAEVHRSVFRLPDDPVEWHEEWPLFPGYIFQPGTHALFDTSNILASKSGFSKLRRFMRHIGEETFICFLLPSEDKARIYSFPADTDWNTYSGGGAASVVHIQGGQTNHVYGLSGRWGAYYIEPWLSWVWGFQDDEVVPVFQDVFDRHDDTRRIAAEYLDELPATKHWRDQYKEFAAEYMSPVSR